MSDDIEKIKALGIHTVISGYLPTESKGRLFYALCPWHNDHRPSLVISPDKELFRCFACDIGGDAIYFVQKFLNLSFREALQDIAQKFNLSLSGVNPKGSPSLQQKFQLYYDLNAHAQKLCFEFARTKGKEIFQQFLKDRHLSMETANLFGIGYCPSGLISHNLLGIQEKYPVKKILQTAEDLGIIKASKDATNHFFDTFQKRITFPLTVPSGRGEMKVIGFTARSTMPDQMPKYLNSKESPVFKKKNFIFGLPQAQTYIKNENKMVIVEGQMDCIQLHHHHIRYAVALSGTAIGELSVTKFIRKDTKIYLAMDSDEAGEKAFINLVKFFIARDILPFRIDLGKHKDPDAFLVSEGSLAFKQAEESSILATDYLLQKMIKTAPAPISQSIEAKIHVLREAFSLFAVMGEKSLYALERLFTFKTELGLSFSSDQLQQAYFSFLKEQAPTRQLAKTLLPLPLAPQQESAPKHHSAAETRLPPPKIKSLEHQFIKIVVENPQLLFSTESQKILEEIPSPEVQMTLEVLTDLYQETGEKDFLSGLRHLLDLTAANPPAANREDKDQPKGVLIRPDIKESIYAALYDIQDGRRSLQTVGDSYSLTELCCKLMKDINRKLRLEHLKLERSQLQAAIAMPQSAAQSAELLNQIKNLDHTIATLNK